MSDPVTGRREDSGPSEKAAAEGLRILVVNQYYAPDLASTGHYAAGICSGLSSVGADVRVITAQPCYTPDAPSAPSNERRDGVQVERVELFGIRGRERPWRRYPGYAVFMLRAGWRALRVAREWEPDVVLTFHNPPFAGLIGALLSRRLDTPFVYSPYDILPDVVQQAGWTLPDWAFSAWDSLNDIAYEAAERVVVLSPGMREHLVVEKDVPADKIEIVRLWARPEIESDEAAGARERLGVRPDTLLLLYAGNMGYMHRLDELLDAAEQLGDTPVAFVFVGGGPRRGALEDRVDSSDRLDRVRVLPYQPEQEFRSLVAAADAGFVSLEEGMGNLAFPSRTLTFLSAGTPILALTAPTAAFGQWIVGEGCGWHASDASGLTEVIRRMAVDRGDVEEKKRRAQTVYRQGFGRARTVDEYARILSEVWAESRHE